MEKNLMVASGKKVARNWGSHSENPQETDSCQQPLESKSFFSEASNENLASANILLEALWGPEAENPAKLYPGSWLEETVR